MNIAYPSYSILGIYIPIPYTTYLPIYIFEHFYFKYIKNSGRIEILHIYIYVDYDRKIQIYYYVTPYRLPNAYKRSKKKKQNMNKKYINPIESFWELARNCKMDLKLYMILYICFYM